MTTPNRQVLHNYPAKMADTPPEHLLPNGHARPHVHDRDTAHTCWCGPRVLEWREKPNGSMGWVVVDPGSDEALRAAME